MGKKRVKVIRWTATRQIVVTAATTAGPWILLDELWHLDRDITVRLKHISGSFGISDDPTDENIDFMLAVLDPDNMPFNRPEGLEQGLWIVNSNWRSIGSDAGPTETTTEVDSVLDSVHSAEGLVGNDLAVVSAVFANTTAAIIAKAVVTADIEYRQARYNNDEFDDQSEEQHAIHA